MVYFQGEDPQDPQNYHEKRKLVLTPADIEAISEAIANAHHCKFTEAERVKLQTVSQADANILVHLAKAYTDATNYIWKGLLALALVGLIWLAMIGAGLKFPFVGK